MGKKKKFPWEIREYFEPNKSLKKIKFYKLPPEETRKRSTQ